MSWLCPRGSGGPPQSLVRFVSKDGEPLFRLEAVPLERAGSCFEIADSIMTPELSDGEYSYHLRWTRDVDDQPLEAERAFLIRAREGQHE